MEILDIVDEHGIPTGKTVERTFAHEQGILPVSYTHLDVYKRQWQSHPHHTGKSS